MAPGAFLGLNGLNAAKNGVATVQALADGRYLDAVESAALTIENVAGAYGNAGCHWLCQCVCC